MKIYLDNAATTPIEPSVLEVMTEVMSSVHGNPSSIHHEGRRARTIVEDARKRVAQNLNASTGEIFFTSSATESNNMAIFCAIRDLGVTRIISSPTEHPSILNTIEYVQGFFKIQADFLKVDNCGNIDVAQLQSLLESSDEKTLVSLMNSNNEIGTILDIEELSRICATYEALLHTDAVQSIGKYAHDLSATKVSFLSGSGHKIYGPKGIGIIYINNDNMIKEYIYGGGQERTLRSGTENVYCIAGFAAALDWLTANRQMHLNHVLDLREYFKNVVQRKGLDLQYNGNQEDNYLHNILSLNIPKNDKTDLIMFNMDINGICASAGSACASGVEYETHVLEAIGAPLDRKTIRLSLSHNNTIEEMDYVIDTLGKLL